MTTRFPSGLWAIVLIASVLLNGLILGAVAAGSVHIGRAPVELPRQGGVAPLGAFPNGMRGEALERLRRGARETRPLMREVRAADAAVADALAADPFDADAARAAFARSAAARSALEARARDTAIEIFADMPADARKQLIETGRDWRGGGPRVILRQELRDGPRPERPGMGGPPPPPDGD